MDCSDDEVLDAFSRDVMNGVRYVPDADHRCVRMRCRLWEYRRAGQSARCPVFVCRTSWRVHRCGEDCTHREQTTEGYVCYLTGLVLGEHHEYHDSLKTDFWGRRVTSTHMRVGTSRRPSRAEAESRRVREWTRRSVRALFCSDARRKTYAARVSKLATEHFSPSRPRDFTGVTFAMIDRIRRSPVEFNPPCASDDPRLAGLAERLAVYALKFRGLKRNQKMVHAFVSACVEKLRCGHYIGTTEMFPVDEFVARHAPDELLHGPLGGMRCRYMSLASLLIVKEITSEAGLPLREMRFCAASR